MASSCDTCKYWGKKERVKQFQGMNELGICDRLHPFWERTEYKEFSPGNWMRALKPEFASDLAFCQDGSDYDAVLLTRPEFFCAHWENKRHGK